MIKHFSFLASLILCIHGAILCQSVDESKLIGTWKLEKYAVNLDTAWSQASELTFFQNHKYILKSSDMPFYGTWEYDSATTCLTMDSRMEDAPYSKRIILPADTLYCTRVQILTDSALVHYRYNHLNTKYTSFYRKGIDAQTNPNQDSPDKFSMHSKGIDTLEFKNNLKRNWQKVAFSEGGRTYSFRSTGTTNFKSLGYLNDPFLYRGNIYYQKLWKINWVDSCLYFGEKYATMIGPSSYSPLCSKVQHLSDSLLTLKVGDRQDFYLPVTAKDSFKNDLPKDLSNSLNTDKTYYLVNSMDTTKTILLDPYNSITLYMKNSKETGIEVHKDGYIKGVLPRDLYLDCYEERNYKTSESGIYYRGFTSYPLSKKYEIQRVPLSEIESVQYFTNTGFILENVGFNLFLTSVVTGFVVAPLVSANFKNGSFNTRRYAILGLSSLAGIAISIPLMNASTDHKVNVTTKDGNKSESLWYLEER
jgi:hypothetical protein